MQLTQSASLFDPLTLVNLARGPIQSIRPLTFESLDQAYGFVLYRTFLEKFSSASLTVQDVHDRSENISGKFSSFSIEALSI